MKRIRQSGAFGFLRAAFASPLSVASVMPSSRALASLITSEIDEHTGPVIELGPGTGVFTEALLANGVLPGRLILIEQDARLASRLAQRYRRVRILCMDATCMDQVIRPDERIGAVISGLPLLLMPVDNVMRLLQAAFARLLPGGCFYLFTYGPGCPVRADVLKALGLRAERLGSTLANIPPATVYRIVRRGGMSTARSSRLVRRAITMYRLLVSPARLLARLKTTAARTQPGRVLFFAWRWLLFPRMEMPGYRLHFSCYGLHDERGIGRVSRELIQSLRMFAADAPERFGQEHLADVYFFSSIHACPKVLPPRSVVMIHDIIPLLFPAYAEQAREWRDRFRDIALQADQLVTISETSRQDIAGWLEVPADKIALVHNGISRIATKPELPVMLPGAPYLTWLGANEWRKNLLVLLQALQLCPLVHLVMVGENQSARDEINRHGLQDRVHVLGWLPDDQVGHVIRHSLALAFPSRYEGFGLPPLEAALLGVPSICSARPAMTELLRDAAWFADPDSPTAWAVAIETLRQDDALCRELARRANEIAQSMTWQAAVSTLHDVFSEVAGRPDPCKTRS